MIIVTVEIHDNHETKLVEEVRLVNDLTATVEGYGNYRVTKNGDQVSKIMNHRRDNGVWALIGRAATALGAIEKKEKFKL